MILRPLEPTAPGPPDRAGFARVGVDAPGSRGFIPAWPVVERLQTQKYESCWMITQPSHAALSGEIAAWLAGPGSPASPLLAGWGGGPGSPASPVLAGWGGGSRIPKLDDELVRAIALHDAGWGIADAQAVTRSRTAKPAAPKSFLETEVAEFLEAWAQSIQVAQSVGPAGGAIVSRHFQRLAEHRIAGANDSDRDRRKLQQFVEHEQQRRKKLAAKQRRSTEELESLTDLLQFCDLLSLYICCGARESVEFPECFGAKLRLTVEEEKYKLDPPLLEPGAEFAFAALRYPETKEISSQEIKVVFTSRSEARDPYS
jgi:hypothetical protein